MVEVIGTVEFETWYDNLPIAHARKVAAVVDLLEQNGVSLGFPHASQIMGSSIALRELRCTGSVPLRVFYAFDPRRQAVLLIGGDKTGDKRFYEKMIPLAERIWKEYLNENP